MPERNSLPDLEVRLAQAARSFPYPPTPNLSQAVLQRMAAVEAAAPPRRQPVRRRLALILSILALLLAALLVVQPVRAAVLDWIRLGAVRIFLVRPTPLPVPTLPPGTLTPIPNPSPTPLASILDLSGETSLADAQARAGFTIRLPAGDSSPDRVYYQDLGGPVIVLVWLDPAQPAHPWLVLSETAASNVIFQKIQPASVVDTTVSGKPALWVDAPYLLITGSGETNFSRLITASHTLIWTAGPLTFRLETSLDLPEAVRRAESLR